MVLDHTKKSGSGAISILCAQRGPTEEERRHRFDGGLAQLGSRAQPSHRCRVVTPGIRHETGIEQEFGPAPVASADSDQGPFGLLDLARVVVGHTEMQIEIGCGGIENASEFQALDREWEILQTQRAFASQPRDLGVGRRRFRQRGESFECRFTSPLARQSDRRLAISTRQRRLRRKDREQQDEREKWSARDEQERAIPIGVLACRQHKGAGQMRVAMEASENETRGYRADRLRNTPTSRAVNEAGNGLCFLG